MDASTASAPPSVQMQLAAMESRLTNLEEAMSNSVLSSLDRMEARLAVVEGMVVALGASLARVSRERDDRARPY